MDIFDIIGPVMIGPSSSHTAGAVKIGNLARAIFGEEVNKIDISLYNSFSKTGKGHGTDKALIAGVLGYKLDDPLIKNAYELAKERGVLVDIHFNGESPKLHPNLAKIVIGNDTASMSINGVSLGGGRVQISGIDGFATEFWGTRPSLITLHNDVPGIVATVCSIFARENINIAFIRLYRKNNNENNNHVLMILETDSAILEGIRDEVAAVQYINKAAVIGG